MSFPLSALQCAIRLILSAALGAAILERLFELRDLGTGWYIAQRHVASVEAAYLALLAIVAVWLVLGVRTRVVALLGLVLFAGARIVLPGISELNEAALVQVGLFACACVPLLRFGGGRFAMIRGGWRGLV